MSNQNNSYEDKQLPSLIQKALVEKNQEIDDLALHLGVSSLYMKAVTSGARSIAALTPEIQRKLAGFLGIKMVELFLLGGLLSKEDL